MIWAWTTLVLTIVALVFIDLFVINRRSRESKPHNALALAIIYLGVAAAFNFALFFAYDTNWMGLGLQHTPDGTIVKSAHEASLQFVTAFLVELSLDLDSVFVFAAVFTYFKTPIKYQRRVLLWGVLAALIIRGGMIGSTGWLINSFGWVRFVLAGLLVLAALRMILIRQEQLDPSKNPIVWLLKRVFPISDRFRGSNLFAKVDGKLSLTPLLVTLIMIETADAVFAIDSVPAVYAVTRDPFIVFAATAFSLLVLRSLFFVLSSYTAWLRYVKVGLALNLAFLAVVMALPTTLRMPTEISLAVVSGVLGAFVVIALILARRGRERSTSPLGEDADRIARLTLKQSRRLIVFVVGTTIVAIGIFMTVGPGPGALVIPIGLAVLASEFFWARKLLSTYATHAQRVGKRAGDFLARFSHPILIPFVLAITGATLWFIITYFKLNAWMVLPGSLPLFAGIGIWSVMTIRQWQARRAGGGSQALSTTTPTHTSGPTSSQASGPFAEHTSAPSNNARDSLADDSRHFPPTGGSSAA